MGNARSPAVVPAEWMTKTRNTLSGNEVEQYDTGKIHSNVRSFVSPFHKYPHPT